MQNELGNVSLFKNVITRYNAIIIWNKKNSNIIIFNDISSRQYLPMVIYLQYINNGSAWTNTYAN